MSDIVWEDPRPRTPGGRPRVWEGRLAPLRDHPGRWANLGTHNRQYVTRINQGTLAGAGPGEFEAKGRGTRGSASVTLYVRYIGGAS